MRTGPLHRIMKLREGVSNMIGFTPDEKALMNRVVDRLELVHRESPRTLTALVKIWWQSRRFWNDAEAEFRRLETERKRQAQNSP